MAMPRRARHLLISGRVQGVGFRWWMVRQAQGLGLDGWVRNRRDGTVEALVAGEAAAVEALVSKCRSGPPAARVDDLVAGDVDAPDVRGFTHRPTQ